MTGFVEIILLSSVFVAAVVAGLILFVLARRGVRAVLTRQLTRRFRQAQRVLEEHRKEQFAGVDRLLFQLGQVQDMTAVESALTDFMDRIDPDERRRLRKLYDSLGLTARYIKDVREASRWVDRAAAARALGQLGVYESVPELVAAMRDPHDDASVKLAAAQALSELRVPEAVPMLISELTTRDHFASPRVAEVLVEFGETAVPGLLTALEDEANPNLRVWAAQILGKIGDTSAINALLSRLRDRSEQVRMSVCEALGELGDRRAVNELVQVCLRDPVAPVRAEASRALGLIGDEEAVRSLVLLLSDPDFWTRLRVVEAIELIRPSDVSMLDAALRDPSKEVRGRAAMALERIGIVSERVEELGGKDRALVERAQRTLVEMGRAGLMGSLLALVDHQDFRIRARVADVLGDVGDVSAMSSLAQLLSDPMWPVRARAVDAVARLRPPDAIAQLVPALGDPEETVRARAVAAIKAVGISADSESLHGFIGLFDSANSEVRESVVSAVGHLQHVEVDHLLRRAVVDPHPQVRLTALKAIGGRPDDGWISLLEGCLPDPHPEVRMLAAEALGNIGSSPALKSLIHCITTPDRSLRDVITGILAKHGMAVVQILADAPGSLETSLALVWTLGKTLDPEALPHLNTLAKREEFEVRAAVAGALGKIPSPGSIPVLRRLAGDRNERVRAAAVNALGSIGGPAELETVVQALQDPDGFVRRRALLSLGKLGTPRALGLLDAYGSRGENVDLLPYVVIAKVLTGLPEAIEQALLVLTDGEQRPRIEAVLARESPDVTRLFRQRLHLPEPEGGRSIDLSREVLSSQYARTLRVGQEAQDRLNAVRSLAAIDPSLHREALIDAVRTDPSPEVRRLALEALGHVGGEDVLRSIRTALRDPAHEVQILAARLLGKEQDFRHNQELLRCFLPENAELDAVLIPALATANAERITEFIDELMGRSEEAILRGGAKVLAQIGNNRVVALMRMWLRGKNHRLRREAVRCLGLIGTQEAKEAILTVGADRNVDMRLEVVTALTKMPGPDTQEVLTRMAKDPSVELRMTLARALGLGPPLTELTLLVALAADPEDVVRTEALRSLVAVGEEEGLLRFHQSVFDQPEAVRAELLQTDPRHPAVVKARERIEHDARPHVRASAMSAIRMLASVDREDLHKWLNDPSPEVRRAAAEAANLDDELVKEMLQPLLRDPDPEVRGVATRRWASN